MEKLDFPEFIMKFMPDLLYDISIGNGSEELEVPKCENLDPSMSRIYNEFIAFWNNKPAITKYELFAAVLAYCADETLLTDMSNVLMRHYPRFMSKCETLTIVDFFKNGSNQTVKSCANKLMDAAEEKSVMKSQEVKVVQTTSRMSDSSARAKSLEYQAFTESKNAEAALRNNVNSAFKG